RRADRAPAEHHRHRQRGSHRGRDQDRRQGQRGVDARAEGGSRVPEAEGPCGRAVQAIRRAVAPPQAGRRERARQRAGAARRGSAQRRQAAGPAEGVRWPRRQPRPARAHARRAARRSGARARVASRGQLVSAPPPKENKFSALLLEGLDHYRKGRMMEAVRAWEEAYTLEPSNLRAREFLRSALERIHAHMAPPAAPQQAAHPWLPPPATQQQVSTDGARKAGGKLPAEPPPAPVQTRSTPQMPWDDGPSMALPQEAPTPGSTEEAGGAWSIHQEPLPVPPGEDDELSAWVAGAGELVALNDFSGAMELLAKILARNPQDAEAQRLHATCEEN